MVSEQINFRYSIAAGSSVRLIYNNQKRGVLTEGFMHFPPGCAAAVQVRILISSSKETVEREVTPIRNQYVALDDANWGFILDEDVIKDDKIIVEMRNTGANDHKISVIVTRLSPQPTQTELTKEHLRKRVAQRRRVAR